MKNGKLVLLGTGIFMWDSSERLANRYGQMYLTQQSCAGEKTKIFKINHRNVNRFVGRRVRIIAEVVENRKSAHIGDLFLKIYPNPKKVGEKIEIGIGILIESEIQNGQAQIGLMPNDSRTKFWCNPNRFYELHDQTVNLWVQTTEDEVLPIFVPTTLTDSSKAIVSSVDNNEITLQIKGSHKDSIKITPKIENWGNGLFVINDLNVGDILDIQ